MAAFYFNTDAQPDFAGFLSVDGNEVVTARELLMRTASDAEHLAEATSRR
jgi:hypothetical protein